MNPKWYRWDATLTLDENEKIHLDEHNLRKYIPSKYTYPKDRPEEIARRQK